MTRHNDGDRVRANQAIRMGNADAQWEIPKGTTGTWTTMAHGSGVRLDVPLLSGEFVYTEEFKWDRV